MKSPNNITKNKQLFINIIASFVSFGVGMGINFFLSPYIIENVGTEAYGFVQLANNFITYFPILTIALNSMSSRFISVSYFKDDILSANEYFSSTFFSNLIISICFIPILVIGIWKLDGLIEISPELVGDVKMLMFFMASNFILSLLSTNLGISYYVKNELYISSIIGIVFNILRAILLLLLFSLCESRIMYIGLVTFIITCFSQIVNLEFKKRMIPELSIKKKYYNWKKVKEMISSGIWNTITRLGSLLSEGLDLLITNICISATDMGVLAIAKTIPNMINNILNNMITTFMPNLTELYAKGKSDELVKSIKQSMKIIGMIINIPIAILIAYGNIFFSLWVPSQDAQLLQILSVITIFPWAIMGQATIIHNIFTVLNKIKVNSLLVCFTGLLNVLVVFILLKTTSLGLFAVAGVSTIFSIIRNVCYTVPFGAIYIEKKWNTFFPEIIKSIISVCIISAVGCVMKSFMVNYSWINLIIFALITAIIGLLFNYNIVLNKEDRNLIKNVFLKKIKRGV